MLTEEKALEPPGGAPSCYKMSLPRDLHYNRFISECTIRLIQEASRSGQPFFAWCSYPDPHQPVAPPAPYCDMYDPRGIPLPSRREGEIDDLPPFYAGVLSGTLKRNSSATAPIPDADWREMIALTYGMITHIDDEIGRVLEALSASGVADNTLIIFVSDHGDMMGDHRLIWKGPYTFRGCINIPTIVSAPGISGGLISDALVSQIDLMPSILDYCGLSMPGSDWVKKETPFERGCVMPLHTHPGRSWMRLLEGSVSKIRNSVVIENDTYETGYNVRCLVTERYRLTIYPGTEHGELFDLVEDPDELFNLWYRDEYKALRSELVIRLLDEYSRYTPCYPVPPWNS